MGRKTSLNTQKNFFNKNYVIILLLIIIVIFIALFVYARTLSPIAIVNNKRITRINYIKELEKQAGNRVLDDIITKMLIYDAAEKRKIAITDTQIQNEIKKIEKDLETKNTALDTMLTTENITRQDLYERIKLNLTTQKIIEKYTQVSDKDIDMFIEKNPEVFEYREVSKEIKEDIRERLRQQKITEQVKILINNLKKNSKIELYIQ